MAKAERDKAHDDTYFMQCAFVVRKASDDPKAARVPNSGVGAILVFKNSVISESANVIPPFLRGHNRSQLPLEEWERYHFIEHAERAAIYSALLAGESLSGTTLYCTRFPCSDCARAIVWFGVSRVVAGGSVIPSFFVAGNLQPQIRILNPRYSSCEFCGTGFCVAIIADDGASFQKPHFRSLDPTLKGQKVPK